MKNRPFVQRSTSWHRLTPPRYFVGELDRRWNLADMAVNQSCNGTTFR